VACGGQQDKNGCISRKVLEDIIKNQFQMTIDLDRLLAIIDQSGDGEIQFEEFKSLLGKNSLIEQSKNEGPPSQE
jgi:Ca2+-binding EF-hand superfamily protein